MMTIIMPLFFSLYIFFLVSLLEIICFLKTNKSMGKGVEQTEEEKYIKIQNAFVSVPNAV